jgi:hypothetical protein
MEKIRSPKRRFEFELHVQFEIFTAVIEEWLLLGC